MPGPGYPQPLVDEDNRPMLEAWREGRLLIQACGSCGLRFFYPRPLCPECWSGSLGWEEASGRASVVTHALVYRPNDPSFHDEVPIVLAEVTLAEGPSMITRIVDCAPEEARAGMALRLVPSPACRRYPLPTFRPA